MASFIQAMRTIVLHPDATDRQHMERFWRADGLPAIQNAELIELHRGDASWQLLSF